MVDVVKLHSGDQGGQSPKIPHAPGLCQEKEKMIISKEVFELGWWVAL